MTGTKSKPPSCSIPPNSGAKPPPASEIFRTSKSISIGSVIGGRGEASDDDWDKIEATIVLDPAQFGSEATAGLGDFSHIEVDLDRLRDRRARRSERR